MKVKTFVLAVFVAVLFIALNSSYAQECCNDKSKSDCKTTGTTSGIVSDSSKLCPVSGEPVNHEGEPVKFTYMGKEYEFCCAGCVKKFKTEPIKYIKEELKCPVMGETVDPEVSTVVDGVKYYFCCPSCIKKFEKDPQKYLGKL